MDNTFYDISKRMPLSISGIVALPSRIAPADSL